MHAPCPPHHMCQRPRLTPSSHPFLHPVSPLLHTQEEEEFADGDEADGDGDADADGDAEEEGDGDEGEPEGEDVEASADSSDEEEGSEQNEYEADGFVVEEVSVWGWVGGGVGIGSICYT